MYQSSLPHDPPRSALLSLFSFSLVLLPLLSPPFASSFSLPSPLPFLSPLSTHLLSYLNPFLAKLSTNVFKNGPQSLTCDSTWMPPSPCVGILFEEDAGERNAAISTPQSEYWPNRSTVQCLPWSNRYFFSSNSQF